jgi:hypothetical protein
MALDHFQKSRGRRMAGEISLTRGAAIMQTETEADMDDRQPRTRWFPPVLSVFAGGLVYALLPHGAFGTYDLAARAAITGAVAGVDGPAALNADQATGDSLANDSRIYDARNDLSLQKLRSIRLGEARWRFATCAMIASNWR